MNSTDTAPTRKIPRIVLLEDEPLLAELYEMCIRDWFKDVDIVKFADGDAAWRELLQVDPDMFIMDWTHPGLNGREILGQLAARKPSYVVLLTSEMFSDEVDPAISQNLRVGYLPKPFGVLQFWRALNEFIGPSDFPERQELLSKQELH
jgi:DNA-binding response OmpR family regulator